MPEHNGHEFEIERRESDSPTAFAHEIVLEVDGEKVMTATDLEKRGQPGPEDGGPNWHTQLERYARAYIDALEARDGESE